MRETKNDWCHDEKASETLMPPNFAFQAKSRLIRGHKMQTFAHVDTFG
jgi:hypothetical protein